MYVNRELYLRKIEPLIDKDIAKVLTGIRRCGKSVLLSLIRERLRSRGIKDEQFASLSFDTFETDEAWDAAEIYRRIKAQAKTTQARLYLFFDEIQELTGWEKLVNSCLTELDCDLYLTGSNSKMLSKELASLLTGRYVTLDVYPFSFAEALEMRRIQGSELDRREAFNEYLLSGGMPFIYQIDDAHTRRQYLRDLAEAIISKDITERYEVRDTDLLRRLIVYLMSNVGNLFSANRALGHIRSHGRTTSWETIANYVEYTKTAYLFLPVAQTDLTGKEILSAQEKLYATDHGFREALYGKNLENASQVLENIVFLELKRHDYEVTVGRLDKLEVDFVARKDGRLGYLQVCYLLADDEIVKREFQSLLRIQDNYPKFVLSLDPLDRSSDGIRHINLIDFLADFDAYFDLS
ncbi:MAG: ATP-binding protein [Coriobacteriales bacterium]|jgi:predicted AAA+ superfamily ATPase|nr:ATP-binding protein [Coriobacteriales bacterium]